jgi:hypothetical protein
LPSITGKYYVRLGVIIAFAASVIVQSFQMVVVVMFIIVWEEEEERIGRSHAPAMMLGRRVSTLDCSRSIPV